MKRFRLGLLTVVTVSAAIPALACIWDRDTLEMERSRFPSALELITGRFARHSPEFYAWRIEDRKQRLQVEPDNLALYDDLAVAYEKTGDHDKAIETILLKDEKQPGLYETHANLGTFYVHSGQFEKGLVEIEKAIAINPNAHFGREIYQKLLVEYVLSRQQEGKTELPLSTKKNESSSTPVGFAAFVKRAQSKKKSDAAAKKPVQSSRKSDRPLRMLSRDESQRAVKGVLGMMRFGNYDSPILLEALGDLLLSGYRVGVEDPPEAKGLAARAYLKASYAFEAEAEERQKYREMAREALVGLWIGNGEPGRDTTLEDFDQTLLREVNIANKWYAKTRSDEIAWIESGADVEDEFAKKYYARMTLASPMSQTRTATHDLQPSQQNRPSFPRFFWKYQVEIWAFSVAAVCCLMIAFLFRRKYLRRRKPPIQSTSDVPAG